MRPIASVPTSAAALACSGRVIPHIFTRVRLIEQDPRSCTRRHALPHGSGRQSPPVAVSGTMPPARDGVRPSTQVRRWSDATRVHRTRVPPEFRLLADSRLPPDTGRPAEPSPPRPCDPVPRAPMRPMQGRALPTRLRRACLPMFRTMCCKKAFASTSMTILSSIRRTSMRSIRRTGFLA